MQSLPESADPNSDGLSLLHDYYFGISPAGPGAGVPMKVATTPSGGYLDVIRATPVQDLISQLWESDDLEYWTHFSASPLPAVVMDDGRFLDRYPLTPGAERRFYRLELSR